MEHRVIAAVLAEESRILAQIHILEIICDKTSVAALHPPAKLGQGISLNFFHYFREILTHQFGTIRALSGKDGFFAGSGKGDQQSACRRIGVSIFSGNRYRSLFDDAAPGRLVEIDHQVNFGAILYLFFDFHQGLRGIQF